MHDQELQRMCICFLRSCTAELQSHLQCLAASALCIENGMHKDDDCRSACIMALLHEASDIEVDAMLSGDTLHDERMPDQLVPVLWRALVTYWAEGATLASF